MNADNDDNLEEEIPAAVQKKVWRKMSVEQPIKKPKAREPGTPVAQVSPPTHSSLPPSSSSEEKCGGR